MFFPAYLGAASTTRKRTRSHIAKFVGPLVLFIVMLVQSSSHVEAYSRVAVAASSSVNSASNSSSSSISNSPRVHRAREGVIGQNLWFPET